jgi:hypothetical protein
MTFQWPFGRTYSVRCPDGTTKRVYRDVDAAFPLYIKGWEGSLSAAGSAFATGDGELKGVYASKIQGLLFGLDELTQTVMINFRSVYMVYASDPCSQSGFLAREVEKLVAEQQRLSRLRIQVRALLELAKNQPTDTVAILTLFKDLAGSIGGPAVAHAAQLEITEARLLADKWSGE